MALIYEHLWRLILESHDWLRKSLICRVLLTKMCGGLFDSKTTLNHHWTWHYKKQKKELNHSNSFLQKTSDDDFLVSLLRFCQLHFHELVRHFVLHSLVDFFCLYSGSVMPWCCSLSLSFDIYTKPFAVLTQEEKVRLVELYAILHLFTIVRSLFLYFFCCCCVC